MIATVAPRSTARSAARTTSPDGAKRDRRVERLGRPVVGAARPLRAQRQRALPLGRRARRDEDAAAPVARDLQRDQRRGAEAVQAEAAARLDAAALERAEADHAAAQERRRGQIVEPVGQAQREVGPHGGVRRVAAVDVPAGERRARAQVLASRAALVAGAVGAGQPGDAGAIAGPPSFDGGADGLDAPDDLVTGHDGPRVHREISFAQLKVGATDAAGRDAQQEHPRSWRRGLALDGAQRPRGSGRGVLEQHGAAGSTHRPLILTFSPQAGRRDQNGFAHRSANDLRSPLPPRSGGEG